MGYGSRNIEPPGGLVSGSLHPEGHLVDQDMALRYEFAPKGILKTRDGDIAGMWVKGRHGKRYAYLLEHPLTPLRETYETQRRNVTVNGTLYENVEVQVHPPVRPFIAWPPPARDTSSDAE